MSQANTQPTCTTDKHGTEEWHLDGKLHRENGPAVLMTNGYHEWWFNGQHFTSFEDFCKAAKIKLSLA